MALKLLLAVTLLAATAAPSSSRVTDPGPIQTQEAARNGNNQSGSPCLTSGSCHASAGGFEGPDGAHRQLWEQKDYISYEAMKRNSIPCTRPTVSYYNCHDNKAVNPYRRSCTAITRCARYR